MGTVIGEKSFFRVLPRSILDTYSKTIPMQLKVVQEDGIEVTPLLTTSVTDLNTAKNETQYKHIYNHGYAGIKFTIDVIIHKSDRWDIVKYNNYTKKYDVNRPSVMSMLSEWSRHLTPLYVVCEAMVIPNDNYVIIGNPTRKQEFRDYSVWTLEFMTYRSLNIYKWANNNSKVLEAIKKANSKNATTKSASTNSAKLSKCNLNVMVYSKNSKVVECNRLMQEVLYKKGFLTASQVDGWFGSVTMNALKKFQTKYAKTYNLKATGKMDKATLNALCKV